MRRTLGLSVLLSACVAFPSTALAKEPENLARLRGIFEKEHAKALAPLAGNYIKALERERKIAMQSDDLDSALAYTKEQNRTKELLETLIKLRNPAEQTESAAKTEKEAKKLEEKKEKKQPKVVSSSHPSTSLLWGGSTKKYGRFLLWAIADGPTAGEIYLTPPSGSKVLIYTWTGNEVEFKRPRKKVEDHNDISKPLQIDIAGYADDPGDYSVSITHSSGEGTLTVYGNQMLYK
jgi:hypothetical protein